MGNETSTQAGRDEWTRSGGTVVMAGRQVGPREVPFKKSTQELPEQRRLCHCVTDAGLGPSRAACAHSPVLENGHNERFTEWRDPRTTTPLTVDAHHPLQLTAGAEAASFPNPHSSFRTVTNVGSIENAAESPRPTSTGTPRSIMLHSGPEVPLRSRTSALSTRSQDVVQEHGRSRSQSDDHDDIDAGSEDSWSDDDNFGPALGNYLLGVSEASVYSRRFPSAVDRESRRVGFGFNGTTSSHRKVSSFRNAPPSRSVSVSRNPRLSMSETGDCGLGLTNSGELNSAAPDGLMPLARFAETGTGLSRHGSVPIKATAPVAPEPSFKRSAQSSVVFNNSVQLTDVPDRQDLLVGNPNHRSSLARRVHTRQSPNAALLRHHFPGDSRERDDWVHKSDKPRVLSLQKA